MTSIVVSHGEYLIGVLNRDRRLDELLECNAHTYKEAEKPVVYFSEIGDHI